MRYNRGMKIIHTADIHLGTAFKGLPPEKSAERRRDLVDAFCRLIDYAAKENVRAVIIAGDLFDSGKTAPSLQKEVVVAVSAHPEIDFLYLRGNHDESGIAFENAPANLKMFENTWSSYAYGEVVIAGAEKFDAAKIPEFDRDKFNIAVLHGEFNINDFRGKNVDYLALGHIHKPTEKPDKIDGRGIWAYCGNLEGRDFGETGNRGFFLLDIENGRLARRDFVPFAKRTYEILTVDISGCRTHSEIEARINAATAGVNKRNVVRVILRGKRPADAPLDASGLERKLRGEFFGAEIENKTTLDCSAALKGDISLWNEFVSEVRKSGLPAEEQEKIIEYGHSAINGENIEI